MKRRADGRWQINVKINGERIYFYSNAKNETLANKDFNNQLLEYNQKQVQGLTFEAVADKWEKAHYPKISYNTKCKYENCVKRLKDYFKGIYIKEISIADAEKFILTLISQGFAKDTISVNKTTLNLIMTYAIINKYIDSNPCAYIKIPSNLPKETREPPTAKEIEVVKSSVDKHFGLYAYLLLYTGCRRSEALALSYEDIDRKNNIIKINKSVEFKNNRPHLKEPKSKSGKREVVLVDALKKVLPKNKKGYVFGGEELYSLQKFKRAWEKYLKETGLKITPHQLRHAYATILYDADIDIKSSQKLLGHANISTTLQIYTHISDSRKDTILDKLNSNLSGSDVKK